MNDVFLTMKLPEFSNVALTYMRSKLLCNLHGEIKLHCTHQLSYLLFIDRDNKEVFLKYIHVSSPVLHAIVSPFVKPKK